MFDDFKILAVDDDVMTLASVRKMIESIFPTSIIKTANDGNEACDIAKSFLPDLIIMDWDMPEMDGINAIRTIREEKQLEDTAIVMLTALSSSKNLSIALRAGAVDYIKKPIDKDEFVARINATMSLYLSYKEIRKQKELVENQSQKLQFLSLVASKTDNSVVIINNQGGIEWVNRGFVSMYGYEFEEFISVFGVNVLKSSHHSQIAGAFEKCIKHGVSQVYETYWETKFGLSKWIQTTLTPIKNEDNHRIEHLIAVETDITIQKQIEEEIRQKNDNLQTLNEHLKEANDLLEQQKAEIEAQKKLIEIERDKSDELLENILPYRTALELKAKGFAKPRHYDMVSVLFTDFKGFTKEVEAFTPIELVNELDTYFAQFDEIVLKHNVEKIKTIGDAYMCAGGLPIRNKSNPFDVVLVGLNIQKFITDLNRFKKLYKLPLWELRLGIHTGSLVAGVVGKKKFAYDIWGDTVNVASRMESSGEVGKVNVSEVTYNYIKDYFDCTYRGKVYAKNKGEVCMYFVNRIKPEYSKDKHGCVPNDVFKRELANY